jgi:hypothetical protein
MLNRFLIQGLLITGQAKTMMMSCQREIYFHELFKGILSRQANCHGANYLSITTHQLE